ncbi:MAG: AMP-dependent synthetase/ligase, partial [Deferrisomatales bacterium]
MSTVASPRDLSVAGSAPGLLAARARRDPGGVALRSKHLGLYRERNWSEVGDRVARCALGLGELGLGRGERVA